MGNTEFIGNYLNSYAVFLPHLTSDHSPGVLIIPKLLKRKKNRAFIFANYIANKPEFIEIMEKSGRYRLRVVKCSR